MSKYNIEIDTDNAAFEDNLEHEIAAVLETLAEKLVSGSGFDHTLRDTNGNKVGTAYLEDAKDEDQQETVKAEADLDDRWTKCN